MSKFQYICEVVQVQQVYLGLEDVKVRRVVEEYVGIVCQIGILFFEVLVEFVWVENSFIVGNDVIV